MRPFPAALLFLALQGVIAIPRPALAVIPLPGNGPQSTTWQSTSVEHAYGLPDTRKGQKGTLKLTPDGLTFTAKSGSTSIQRGSILAVSSGNQRVELWGIKGRLLRMAIPDGGGVVTAGFMHHRVDMLTVEFSDSRGGYHGAVFFLPANEADRALQSFSQTPPIEREPADTECRAPVEPASVLVAAPAWDQSDVPAAYRALVYEHLVDRLQRLQGVSHVYRDGEVNAHSACPQYTVHLAITGFTLGSQVERAVMGPVGMFAGTTQMRFDTTFADATGRWNLQEQIKATVRGEQESTNVADGVAKDIAKHYASAKKAFDKTNDNRPKQ